MNHKRNFIFLLGFLTIFIPLVATCQPNIPASFTVRPTSEEHPPPPHQLTPAQQHSGELLAYLLKVVLGRAGQTKSREDWRVKAIHEPLDFDHIVKVMTDPEENQLDFVVLDPNILDLSQVVYHYDETLSLYKGEYGITSVYPAPEILAIRLFLLKKMNAGEKIDLDAFMKREANLLNPNYRTSPEDLAATGLSALEMKFLRDTFQNDPAFYRYLASPFLLKEIAETGVLASGDLTEKIIQSAHYTPFPCKPIGRGENRETVKIAFLPSMTKEFVHGKNHPSLSEHGFKPTEFLEEVFIQLKKEIIDTTQGNLKRKLTKPPYPELTESQWRKLWHTLIEHDIAFYIENKRPLVIYPENASQVIREVCPEADFTVILLGKNIYRAIYFDLTRDVYPFVNRLYIDILDIKYHQAQEEIETISRFIRALLKNRIAALIDRMER
ncbi:MAG: hypothetical protein GY846_09990 [Deltaproteobacteria bacterium]|nr:hypothetical protein [Deltaproteobacteria bacterium]